MPMSSFSFSYLQQPKSVQREHEQMSKSSLHASGSEQECGKVFCQLILCPFWVSIIQTAQGFTLPARFLLP